MFEGTDLNRTWDTASPHAHPTVHTIRDVIDKLSKTVFTSFADDSKDFWCKRLPGKPSRLCSGHPCLQHTTWLLCRWQCLWQRLSVGYWLYIGEKTFYHFFSPETSGTLCFQKCLHKTAATFPTRTQCTTRFTKFCLCQNYEKKTGHFLPGLYITQIHVRQLPLFTGSRQGWNSEASSFRYDRVGEHQCLLSGGDSRTHTHTSIFDPVSLWLFSLPPLHFLLLSLIHHYLVEGHQCQILQS